MQCEKGCGTVKSTWDKNMSWNSRREPLACGALGLLARSASDTATCEGICTKHPFIFRNKSHHMLLQILAVFGIGDVGVC